MKACDFAILPVVTALLMVAVCAAQGGEYTKEMEVVQTDWAAWLKGRPMIAVRYGSAAIDRDGFAADFADPGAIDLQLGYTNVRSFRQHETLVKVGANWLSLANSSTDTSIEESQEPELESDTWRFGLGHSSGCGYKLGSKDGMILPYHSWSAGWSIFDVDDAGAAALTEDDSNAIRFFDEETRFGTTWEGGLRIAPVRMVALDAGYEQAIVFPRTKVGYWLISTLIEELALGAIDAFINSIADTSPRSAPVMNFLLKSGMEIGLHELRREKMNWPLDTAPPLTYETLRAGLRVTF